jgi:PadR family transcriptional regulator, regulatory protein PadR
MSSNKRPLLPGTLNLLILKSIGGQGLHGLEIQQRIEMASGRVFDVEEGSLYPALHRLAHDGLIVGEWAVTERGRRGKYYKLTPKGRKQLRAEIDSWRICSEAIEKILCFN